ncbi:hypothetical protein PM082_017607 [Marasmius tenuissimus]|nr:hypothetical protein PM082_017607 [Marasmius tenuissimus]
MWRECSRDKSEIYSIVKADISQETSECMYRRGKVKLERTLKDVEVAERSRRQGSLTLTIRGKVQKPPIRKIGFTGGRSCQTQPSRNQFYFSVGPHRPFGIPQYSTNHHPKNALNDAFSMARESLDSSNFLQIATPPSTR